MIRWKRDACTPGTVGTSGATTVALLENGDAGKKANEDVAAHVTVLSRQSKSEPRAWRAPPTSSPNSHRSVDDKSNLAFLHAGAPADDGACMAAFASKALDPLGDKHPAAARACPTPAATADRVAVRSSASF